MEGPARSLLRHRHPLALGTECPREGLRAAAPMKGFSVSFGSGVFYPRCLPGLEFWKHILGNVVFLFLNSGYIRHESFSVLPGAVSSPGDRSSRSLGFNACAAGGAESGHVAGSAEAEGDTARAAQDLGEGTTPPLVTPLQSARTYLLPHLQICTT